MCVSLYVLLEGESAMLLTFHLQKLIETVFIDSQVRFITGRLSAVSLERDTVSKELSWAGINGLFGDLGLEGCSKWAGLEDPLGTRKGFDRSK